MHGLSTKYIDFWEYLRKRFHKTYKEVCCVPEPTCMLKGGMEYDLAEAANYIIDVIDNCNGGDWSFLEADLGVEIFDTFSRDLFRTRYLDDEKELRHSYYYNEEMSGHIAEVFPLIQDLVVDWGNDELGNIDFTRLYKPNVAAVLSEGEKFLTFNYTRTLEELYVIDASRICHVHGEVGDEPNNIYFGHGDDAPYIEDAFMMGTEGNFSELKRKLRKDTGKALHNHIEFFNGLSAVDEICSFGFSFSAVDQVYIEEISKQISGKNITWFLDSYSLSNNPEYKTLLQTYGFKVAVEKRW